MSSNTLSPENAKKAEGDESNQKDKKDEKAKAPERPRRVNACVILQTKEERRNSETALPETNRRPVEGGYALALDRNFYWNKGAEIHIRFLNGDPETHKLVERFAREWESVANIHFVFDNAADAPVRIKFSEAGGGWSALGYDCVNHSKEAPTMGIGVQKESGEFRSTVLHEFGHVLGCVHEHSSPMADIKFKRENVYKHYKNKWNWSEDEVDKQILHRYHALEVEHTMYDRESIMIYPLDSYIMEVTEKIHLPTDLSPQDKEFIRRCYPNPEIPEAIGVFYSWDYQRWGLKVPRNTARVTFPSRLSTKPKIAVGLTQFDLEHGKDLRIMTLPEDITQEDFHIRTKTWDDSIMYSAGSMWFKIDESSSKTLQTGVFNTDYDTTCELRGTIEERVDFPRPFPSTPAVAVFLKGFHLGCGSDWKLSVTTESVEKSGFKLCISCGEETILHQAIVTWIAYASDDPNIFSGAVHSDKGKFRHKQSRGPGLDARKTYIEKINLQKKRQGCTTSKFRVYTAVNAFHFGHTDNLRLHAESQILADGNNENLDDSFWVTLKTWNTSECYSAGASYLVVYE